MTVLDRVIADRALTGQLEQALRRICDLLTDDGPPGPLLIELRDQALPAALEVLDAAETATRALAAGAPAAAEVVDVARTAPEPRALDVTAGGRACATCKQTKPEHDYGRMGKGRSKSCRACVQARNVAAARKRRAREAHDDKESTKVDRASPQEAGHRRRPPGAPVPGIESPTVKIPDGWRR